MQSGLVGLRTGPGVDYPLVAQLGPDLPITVVGRNDPNTWLQICCVVGRQSGSSTQGRVINDPRDVAIEEDQ